MQSDYPIIDEERAYQRGIFLMSEIENEARTHLDGRTSARGIWRLPPEIIQADLRAKLYQCPTYGAPLDEWLHRYFDGVLNVRVLKPAEPPRYERRPALTRELPREYEPDWGAPEVFATSFEIDLRDEDGGFPHCL